MKKPIFNNIKIQMSDKNNFHYQKSFWQNYKVIYQHFMNKQKEMTNIFYIFNKLSNILSDFSNGLNFISTYPFDFDSKSTFGSSMKMFIELIKYESETILNFTKNTLDLIMMDISTQVENLASTNKDIISGRSDSLNSFINSLYINDSMKREYHIRVGKAIQKKLEITKKKGKDNKELGKLVKEAIKSREEYKLSLINCNNNRIDYINRSSDAMKIFEKREKNIIDETKKQLIKYCNDKMKSLEEISKEIKKKLEENFEKINSEYDIQQFVENNRSLGSQPIEVSFVEYAPDFPLTGTVQEKNLLTSVMKNFLEEKFKFLDEQEEIIQITKKYCENIWNGNISEDDLNKLINSFSIEEKGKEKIMDKKVCFYFLNYFNKKRTTGRFGIDNKTYDALITCMINLLDLNDNEICDYEICGLIIILSLTYFKYNEKGKEYIEKNIENHNIFKKKEFWFDLASYYIQENYHEQDKGVTGCVEELDEENKSKIKSVADAKVSTILYNMKQFHVPLNLVKELSEILCNQFNIEKSLINTIWNLHHDEDESKQNEEDSYQIFVEQEEEKKNNQINFEKEVKEIEDIINNEDKKEEK